MHDSFHEICGIFERYLTSQDDIFLFGQKPTNADFAMVSTVFVLWYLSRDSSIWMILQTVPFLHLIYFVDSYLIHHGICSTVK